MGPNPYSNPSFEQATGQVPINDPGISGKNNASANPVLDALSEAVRHAQGQVDQANKQLQSTPMYSQHSGGQPVMPVPRNLPFQGSSVHNLDSQQPVTRAGARNKAVGQIAAQAGNIIGKYMAKKEAEKTQNLAQDIHRSMELNQGIDEANQILQQDPNNAAAKAQLQKNQTLLKALLDGKNGKNIAKAYDITFGATAKEDAEKNAKKPEKAAMQGAMKQIQEDNRLEQFRGQLPQAMGPNPAYETALKNALDVQKQADTLTKTYATMAGKVMDIQGRQNVADTAAAARTTAAATTAQGGIEKEKLRLQGEYERDKQKHLDKMKEIGAQISGRLTAIKEMKKESPSKAQAEAGKMVMSLDTSIQKAQDAITKIDVELNKPETKQAENTGAKKALNEQKEAMGAWIKDLREKRDQAILEQHSDPDAAAMYSILGPGKDEEQ